MRWRGTNRKSWTRVCALATAVPDSEERPGGELTEGQGGRATFRGNDHRMGHSVV